MSDPIYLPTLDEIDEQKAIIREAHMVRRRQEPRQYYAREEGRIREFHTRLFHGKLVLEDV